MILPSRGMSKRDNE